MASDPLKERITSKQVLNAHLAALAQLDPRLAPVLELVGQVPLRLGPPGFAGLANIVVSQLLSVASARAIYGRVEALAGEMKPGRFLVIATNDLRAAGLSRSKIACLRALARAEQGGELNFARLHELDLPEATKTLIALKGIGPWSAQLYLLASAGHPDVFPAGDLVLQKMVGKVAQKRQKPDEKATSRIAQTWSPYRGAAARLLWRYFAVLKEREGINL